MNKRIQYIDRLKGLAILLVIMGHVPPFCFYRGAETMSLVIESFHMPLFMFLSGLVVRTNIAISIHKYWFKKIGALLLPMTVFGLCFTMYYSNTSNISILPQRLYSFLLSNNKMGYWYLFDLALFYMTMPLFSLFKKPHWWIDALIGCLIEFLFFIGWKQENTLTDILCLLNATSFYPFFIMGYMAKKYNFMEQIKRNNSIFTASLLLYIFLFAFEYQNHAIHTLSWRLILPLSAIIVCSYLFMHRDQEQSILECQLSFLGKHTLDIYILHYFIVSALNLSFLGSWFEGTDNQLLATVTAAFIAIPTAYASIYAGQLLRNSTILRKYAFGEIFSTKQAITQ